MSKKTHSAADGYILMEMLAVSASREIKDGEVVFAGTGLPMLAALLAKATHAPNSVMVTEAGIYDPSPLHMPTSVSDSRWYYNSPWSAGPHELMHYFLQAGRIDVGFLGGAQIDRYGNLNSTVVGDYNHPKRRLPGAGGASDIAILSKRTIISMVHEKRRFVDSVDYITTPGWKCWKYPEHELVAREELDMWGGPAAVVSDMGVMKFDEDTKEMYVAEYFADRDITPEMIKENTAFDIDLSRAVPAKPPTDEELTILREEVDPNRFFLGRQRKES